MCHSFLYICIQFFTFSTLLILVYDQPNIVLWGSFSVYLTQANLTGYISCSIGH
jgi:hypothetical protein